jgi:hypothetical protein
MQPFRGDQKIIVERRFPDGSLDLQGEPQPPTVRCKCCGHVSPGIMKFNDLWALFWKDAPSTVDRGTSAGYEEMHAWLKSKGWTIRAMTW